MKKQRRLLPYLKERLPFLVLLLCMISMAATGFVYAKYAQVLDTDVSVNIVASGDIEIQVVENEDGTYKIRHATGGNTPAYVRFAVIVNWADGEGNLFYTQPGNYTVTVDNCTKLSNYYYYNGVMALGQSVGDIAVTLKSGTTAPLGYPNLQVQILAEGIQCQPETTARAAWGVEFNGTDWR